MDVLGQFFICGYQGSLPSSDFLKLIPKYNLGGLIFFARNIITPLQLSQTIEQLKSYFKTPPLLAIDQEGGKINRIQKDFPLFPANKFYGDRKDKTGVEESYYATAGELFRLGLNLNLVPVVDVLGKEGNFIGQRSFGKEVDLVCQLSQTAIKAVRKAKLLTCAKHFPGIGSLEEDPHEELPKLSLSRKDFEKKEFLPFKSAIKAGVDTIMTTHVIASGLDSQPVTFSKKIVSGILQKKLKFQGLVLSDDMEMKAIINNFDFKEACLKAFLAGHDQILICHNLERQMEVLEYFKKLIKDKKIPASLVKKRAEKILKFKKTKLKF